MHQKFLSFKNNIDIKVILFYQPNSFNNYDKIYCRKKLVLLTTIHFSKFDTNI
jgi:hypothetical protein